jgi:lipopolysaccharide transport protein LptA
LRRLRFLRILLPVALIVFLVLVVIEFDPPEPVHREQDEQGEEPTRQAIGLRVVELRGDTAVLEADAGLVKTLADGRVLLEDIARFIVDRPGEDPLEIAAALGEYEGEPGSRFMRFTKQVELRDPSHDLLLILPALEVDEAASEARCTRELSFEGPTMRGTAATLVYGLSGQPTRLTDPVLKDTTGLTIRSRSAVLLDGFDDVELLGDVLGERGDEEFRAERLRWTRDEEGEVRWMESAGEPANAVLALEDGLDAEVVGRELDARWDDAGLLEAFGIHGQGLLRRGTQSLSAQQISGQRSAADGAAWEVAARDAVYLRTVVAGDPAWLRTDDLEADFDAQFALTSALAVGQVRFEGPATRAEADRATFLPTRGVGEILLEAVERPKARLARERIRVAGLSIRTDPRGTKLVAEGKVEATMLPGQDGRGGIVAPGMFRMEEAVHFVARRLNGEEGGRRLTFSGGVRGWQGDRNLAAEEVVLDQQGQSMTASVDVTTRMPRDSEQASLSEADYVQVAAQRLFYDDRAKLAVYSEEVRVRMAEGWLEARRMEIDLSGKEERVREVRAFEGVRIEFRDPQPEAAPRIINGTGDRMTYDARERIVHLYGDRSPAQVRRVGENGGTTTGRVLRYHLDTGTLEVDAGELGPARIRTGAKAPPAGNH